MKEYLMVDGYNIINQWEELREESRHSLDSARIKLLDIMSNYQAFKGVKVIVVFDAHYVKNSMEKHEFYNAVEVVYTKEFESADNYIERFVADHYSDDNTIRVATSDSLEQMVVLGLGAARISARELKTQIQEASQKMDKNHINMMKHDRNLLEHHLDPIVAKKLESIRRQKS
ncbi:MAG: NYN domain-containing protein [Lutispora sp.]|nr:NYN domain-containing protein [Lutispora sp.]MDD4833673.1 NYN domain-containing protein [Lutispora sp.]